MESEANFLLFYHGCATTTASSTSIVHVIFAESSHGLLYSLSRSAQYFIDRISRLEYSPFSNSIYSELWCNCNWENWLSTHFTYFQRRMNRYWIQSPKFQTETFYVRVYIHSEFWCSSKRATNFMSFPRNARQIWHGKVDFMSFSSMLSSCLSLMVLP